MRYENFFTIFAISRFTAVCGAPNASFFAVKTYEPGAMDRYASSASRQRRLMRFRSTAFDATFFETTQANRAVVPEEGAIATENSVPCTFLGCRMLRIWVPESRCFVGICLHREALAAFLTTVAQRDAARAGSETVRLRSLALLRLVRSLHRATIRQKPRNDKARTAERGE